MGNLVRSRMILGNTNPTKWGKANGFTSIQMHRVLNLGWGKGNPGSISWKIVEALIRDGFLSQEEAQQKAA